MSKDIVRQSTSFGEDHGLLHEVVITGRKVGADREFYSRLAHDENLFRQVVDLVSGVQPEKEDPLQAVMNVLQHAAAKGVQCENGVYRFFDPGIPLVMLRKLQLVREQKLVYQQDWYDGYDWAKREDAPQERTLRIPVENSFGKSFSDQEKLLSSDEEVPSTRSVATFLVINALATGKRLLPDCYVRCIDKDSGGDRMYVGIFGARGLDVNDVSDDLCFARIGVVASRKS